MYGEKKQWSVFRKRSSISNNLAPAFTCLFFEILAALHQAHKTKDEKKAAKIYEFAEWCLRQQQQDLWNAAGVAFYEHLGEEPETLQAFTKWIKPNIYKNIRGLLKQRLPPQEIKRLDLFYGYGGKENIDV